MNQPINYGLSKKSWVSVRSTSVLNVKSDNDDTFQEEEDFFFSPGNDCGFNFPKQNDIQRKDEFSDELFERVGEIRSRLLDLEKHKYTPNPNTSPYEVVRLALNALRNPDDPLPDSGYKYLLKLSTDKWRKSLLSCIGATSSKATKDQVVIASALEKALSRPQNQYAILVNEEDGNDYFIHFPSDIVDLEDGKCWLECHLLHPRDGSLLVITGWEMERRGSDGAWLVDSVDWQDFRDSFRPGIGREEWMRVCG